VALGCVWHRDCFSYLEIERWSEVRMSEQRAVPVARQIMQRHVQSFSGDAPIRDALRALLKSGHSGAPVLDAEGQVMGVLSEHDVLRAQAEAAYEGTPAGSVADYMTRDVECVTPEEDLFRLVERITGGGHRRLLVTEAGRPVGIISRRDLMKALAALEGKSRPESTYDAIARQRD
jgi:CBS domain-containing protein